MGGGVGLEGCPVQYTLLVVASTSGPAVTLTKENLVIVVNVSFDYPLASVALTIGNAFQQKTKVHDVLWKCGEILEITEDKLFGLALRQPTEGIGGDQPRHEYFFLDPAQKIVKYAPKQPRFSQWHNRSTENRPLLVLYFRVRVYIDQVRLLTCPRALEHYYLQLKDNFLDQWASRHSVSEERCWEMAALALKVDKGNNPGGYFRAEQYFPIWVIDVRGLEYVRKYMPAASEDLKDMSRVEAMMKFAFEASRSPFALNCHLYGLRRHKMDTVDNAVLGINAKGIEMCDIGDDGERIPLRSLPWNRVTRLSFDRKKLTIVGADTTKMCLYAQSESKARYLLELCRAVHQTLLVLSHQNDIRQERAASQSSKTSDTSDHVERRLTSAEADSGEAPHDFITHPTADVTNIRPASVDSASQTVETSTRCAPVDVNFNLKSAINTTDLDILEAYGIPYQGEIQYASSGGSRSDSVQHSNEMLPETMLHGCHHEQGCARSEDADSTLRSTFPQQSSVSLHDLRTAGIKPPPGYIDERTDNDGAQPTMDQASIAVGPMAAEAAGGQPAFPPASATQFATHDYFIDEGTADDGPSGSLLSSVPRGKTRDPPPYERALDIQRTTTTQLNPHLHLQPSVVQSIAVGPMAAEAAGGQPAFPPASATQFATHDYFIDEEGLSTERLRDFPMMHRLLRESNSLLSHQRRPSSCIDLTSEYVTHLPMPVLTGNFHVPLHRGDYFPDSAVHNYAPYMRTPNMMPATYAWRPPAPAAVMDLPPPPPYPAGRKAPMVM
ncbi:FERM central domain protein [Teladorsagia circumcincta]|uniref:FERM central domain protein n=2 Tax=Trichostrongylidae TaxID=6315 RepID=A0A2G9UXE1_TELCI|nr:FERM central domain protein [Teladorsagia circumcincta]